MNDRYLYKAKGLDNGEWIEGCLTVYEDGTAQIHATKEWWSYDVDPSTICQYTGLMDKNGNKIWENDIIKNYFLDGVALIKFGEYQNSFDTKKTCHIGFYVDWKKEYRRKDLGFWVKKIDGCNIVGNKFDNPELLESEK